ncbi:MAG: peptidylprolyl isomerase [Planctomycetota bacterium]
MNEKTFNVLGITAAVMVVASVFVGLQKPTVSFGFSKGRYLIPHLNPSDVASVHIKSKGEEIKLDRNGDQFVVTSKLSYPASNKELNSLLRDLAKIQLAAEVSDSKDAHKGLGVAEDSDDAKVVRFFDRENKEIVGLVVGKAAEGTSGYNVRLANDDKVYRTDSYVYVRDKSLDYVDKEIVNNERNQIEKVEVKPAQGQPYVIASPKEGEVKLEGIPDGKRAKNTLYESVFSASSYMNFEDLAPAAEKQDLEFTGSQVVTRRDGAKFTFDVAKKDDKFWLRAHAEYVGPDRNVIGREVAKAKNAKDEDKNAEDLKKKEAFLQAEDAVKDFNQRHQSWVYQVGNWKAENLAKPFDDLIEDVPAGPEEITAQHILISFEGATRSEVKGRTKEEARQMAEELLPKVKAAPDDFGKLADENTDDPTGKGKGGDLGTFKRDAMTKAFSDAAFKLEVGAISDVVETEFGFHIIKRTK